MTTKQVRRKAAEIIEAHGLLKGRFGTEGGPRCVLGALMQAAPTGSATKAANELSDELGIYPLSYWNDAPERTAAEVIAALRGERVIAQQPKETT